jgi:hypothetical protein
MWTKLVGVKGGSDIEADDRVFEPGCRDAGKRQFPV